MHKRPTRRIAIVVLLLGMITVGPWFRGAIYAASQRVNRVMVPVIVQRTVTPTHDLRITHLGLYQSVQNASNSVPLVAGKPAMLRVYVQETSGANPPAVAEVRVQAQRGGQLLGSLSIGPQAVSTQPSADRLNSTFNFDLPAAWLSGDVTLTADVDAVNTVPEFDETNNRRVAQFAFRAVAPLQVTIIPIHYLHTPTGTLYNAAAHDPISQWLLSAYPISQIDVALHAPYSFSGDLRKPGDWTRLLEELTTLWAAEVGFGSAHVFYGLIPVGTPAGESWFEGGISGLGWIGERVSIGLDVGEDTAKSAGHEIGHNFGRRHAPCGNPTSVDPHYPYPNASIGVVGVDTADDTLLLPAANYDMMSYCGPEWVSDYTYEALFLNQLARGGREADAGSGGLLLRAALDGDTVTALPVYTVDTAALTTTTDGEYTAQLLDRHGAVIGSAPATRLQAEETGVMAEMLIAHVTEPGAEIAAVRFLRRGEKVAERLLAPATARNAGQLALDGGDNGLSLEWGAPDVPAMVQYSADGQDWTTLAVDVLGGRLSLPGDALAGGQYRVVLADGGVEMVVGR